MYRNCSLALAFVLLSFGIASGESIYWSYDPNFIDLTDLNDVRNNFGGTGFLGGGEYTYDGLIDLEDLNFVRNRFGAPDFDPPSWVKPSQPTTADAIQYYVDFGGGINECLATNTFGAPYFVVDEEAKSVRIAFDQGDPSDVCADYENARRGLTGDFGPLTAGHWTLGIEGEAPYVEFDVVATNPVPEPSTLLLATTAIGIVVCRRWAVPR